MIHPNAMGNFNDLKGESHSYLDGAGDDEDDILTEFIKKIRNKLSKKGKKHGKETS